MQTFLTTTTGPPWTMTVLDPQGNALPAFASASFTLTFRSVSTRQKVRGQGSWLVTNASLGQVQYSLAPNDLALAYAAFSPLSGIEIFEIFVEALIALLVYDGLPFQIRIQKV